MFTLAAATLYAKRAQLAKKIQEIEIIASLFRLDIVWYLVYCARERGKRCAQDERGTYGKRNKGNEMEEPVIGSRREKIGKVMRFDAF